MRLYISWAPRGATSLSAPGPPPIFPSRADVLGCRDLTEDHIELSETARSPLDYGLVESVPAAGPLRASALTCDFGKVHPTGQKAKMSPQIGRARAASQRPSREASAEGYRKDEASQRRDGFQPLRRRP